MSKPLIKFIALVMIVLLNGSGIFGIAETFAYFSDIEDSNTNSLTAGVLNMTVRSGQNNFVSGADDMIPGKQVNRDVYVGNTSVSLPLKHNVDFEFTNGDIDLCNQLDLKIWYNHYFGSPSGGYANRDMRPIYNGKLSVLSDHFNPDFEIPHYDDLFDIDSSDGLEQWFFYSISIPDDIPNSFQGKICNFKFIYEAWQTDLSDSTFGFSDVEEIDNSIKMGYWDPPIVLNEFLPNHKNYPEFIEIYNKTAFPIDLTGFYIQTNNTTIPIETTTTATFSGGSTQILGNNWLVVTTGGDIMNDSSGTITLYNQNGIKVDSYDYNGSENNINNTPGQTNNLAAYLPLNGDLLDKSGNGNNGINYGAIQLAGKINQGLSFDGIDDYIQIADSTSLDIVNQITVEGWIKPDSFSQRQTIAGKWRDINGANERGYLLTIGTDGVPHFYISTTGIDYIDAKSFAISAGQWHHLVGTYDGIDIKLFVDGVLLDTTPKIGSIYSNNESLLIGATDGWGGTTRKFTNGIIDEVKIYNRALSSDEVIEHYNDVGISGLVPVDKSYARIPDGIGDWIDPIPTPGTPNKSDIKHMTTIRTVQEMRVDSSIITTLDSAIISEAVEEVIPAKPLITKTILTIETPEEIKDIEQKEEIIGPTSEESNIEITNGQIDIYTEENKEQIYETQEKITAEQFSEASIEDVELIKEKEKDVEQTEEQTKEQLILPKESTNEEIKLVEEDDLEPVEVPIISEEPEEILLNELTSKEDEITE